MKTSKAASEDLAQIKRLWTDIFDDGTPGFCDFLFDELCSVEDVYITKDEDKVVSMLIMALQLEYKGRKGLYIYSACTHSDYRGRGLMSRLIDYAVKDKQSEGFRFFLLQPANEKLFDFYAKLGFTTVTYMRRFFIDVKKNLWASGDFDIVTAGRLPALREKYREGNEITFSGKQREKYMKYLYTFGGSTVENDGGYAVYYIENDIIDVKEICAASTQQAMGLLQAVREKTGCERAKIALPQFSNLFLGEGREEKHCRILGLEGELSANLMFE